MAPAHYAHCVREWLDINFNDKWIGRRGLFKWPARSPDLSLMDFFLWGVLKDMCTKRNHELFLTFAELLLTKLPQLMWNYAKRFVAVLLHDWFPVLSTTRNNLNFSISIYNCCNLTSFRLIIVRLCFIHSYYCACSSHLSYRYCVGRGVWCVCRCLSVKVVKAQCGNNNN